MSVRRKKQRIRHELLPTPADIGLSVSQTHSTLLSSQKGPFGIPKPNSDLPKQGGRMATPLMLTEDDVSQDQVVRTVLADSIEQEKSPQPWAVRMMYAGTLYSNLTHLININKPNFAWHELHYPFPSIRPTLPWKPHKDMPFIRWHSHIACDMGMLPDEEMADHMIADFFTKINPGFPIVNEVDFRARYADHTNPLPLILLQSVLLAGLHVCSHPRVRESRSVMQVTTFRRAKALFNLHYENDRLHVIQAALLLAWHSEGADDACANFYYWTGVACRIAFGLGLHRNVFVTAPRMPLQDQRLCRRIWWTLFQFEVFSALHHGRPLMIDLDECDQPGLTTEDFDEGNSSPNGNIQDQYCMENAKLCEILIAVIKLYSPGSLRRIQSAVEFEAVRRCIDRQLAGWFLQLPPQMSSAGSSSHSFWTQQLHLHYHMVLLHLHRTPFLLQSSHPTSPLSASPLARRSAEICATAASSISKTFDGILCTGSVAQCWFTATTAVLAAAIQMTSEIRRAHGSFDPVLALQSQGRLETLFPVMETLTSSWASMDAVQKLFKKVFAELSMQSRSLFVRHHDSDLEGPVYQHNGAEDGEQVDDSLSEPKATTATSDVHASLANLGHQEVDLSTEQCFQGADVAEQIGSFSTGALAQIFLIGDTHNGVNDWWDLETWLPSHAGS